MELDYIWMFAVVFVTLIAVTAFTLMLRRFRKKKTTGTPLANTSRLRSNPAFLRALRRRRIGLVALGGLLLVTLSAATLVASRPVLKTIENPVKYTRDIVLCLDVSGSMIETDLGVIQTFKQLIQNFNGERVSLVVFNSVASQVFPLTDNYRYIDGQLDYVYSGFFIDPPVPGYDFIKYTYDDKGASLIGDGLTACTMSFEFDDPERSRSIILATDNVPNGESVISLPDAVGFAKNRGVKLYILNPGSVEFETKELLPEREQELKDAATSTNGIYFPVDEPGAVSEIVRNISQDTTTEVRGNPVVKKTDDEDIFLWVLIGLTIPTLFVYRRLSA